MFPLLFSCGESQTLPGDGAAAALFKGQRKPGRKRKDFESSSSSFLQSGARDEQEVDFKKESKVPGTLVDPVRL